MSINDLRSLLAPRPWPAWVGVALVWSFGFSSGVMFTAVVILLSRLAR